MALASLLQDLRDTHDRTLACFDLSGPDLDKSYAPGKWTVRQLLHHLADAETVLYDRIRRIISEPRQVIWAFDQDGWAANLDYTSLPLALNKAVFSSIRQMVVELTMRHYEKDGDKTFVHSETGVRSLRDEMEKIAWHNAHHLAQIEQALGR